MKTAVDSCKVIAICNRKGGVGKSTSVSSIGGALASMGYKTLLLDLDDQCDLTSNFMDQIPDDTVYQTFAKKKLPVVHIKENLDIIPGDRSLTVVNDSMEDEADKFILDKALKSARENYSFILLDCPPALSWIVLNAFTAAAEGAIFVPMHADKKSFDGLARMAQGCYLAGRPARINGIFFTEYSSQTKVAQKYERETRASYGDIVFKTGVRKCVRASECAMAHKDLISYDPTCTAALDYLELTAEILGRLGVTLPEGK